VTRPAIVLGLQPAGLALARSLGRRGVPVTGIAFERADFGLRSRYVRERHLVLEEDDARRDARALDVLRTAAVSDGPVVVVPERDAHVDFVLRNEDAVRALAAVPLPDDRAAVDALRDKRSLAEVAERAALETPRTVPLPDEDAVRACPLPRPFLLKPLESERFAAAFSRKVVVVERDEDALEAWRSARAAGFELFAQDLVPGSTDRILSLFAYIGTTGALLGSVVGRKVRQGPPGFGASTIFRTELDDEVLEAGARLLASVGYRGFAHVELVRDPRDGALKLLEVNTRLPVWAGVGMSPRYDVAPLAYADLCGDEPEPLPPFAERLAWTYLAKDVVTVARLARRRELDLASAVRPYRESRVPAVRSPGDRGPGYAVVTWWLTRAVEKLCDRRKAV